MRPTTRSGAEVSATDGEVGTSSPTRGRRVCLRRPWRAARARSLLWRRPMKGVVRAAARHEQPTKRTRFLDARFGRRGRGMIDSTCFGSETPCGE